MTTRWGLRGNQIRDDGGNGQHVATYMRNREDGLLLAAAPELLEMLLEALDDLEYRSLGKSPLAERVHARLRELDLTPPPPECMCKCYFARTGKHADGCPFAEDEQQK